jgi:hypothetical protein
MMVVVSAVPFSCFRNQTLILGDDQDCGISILNDQEHYPLFMA